MKKIVTLQDYEDRHNNIFPDKPIKVVKREGRYIFFETEFGLCKKFVGNFGKLCHTHESSINKVEYLKNMFIKIYKDKYDYSHMTLDLKTKKVTIFCKIHGDFTQRFTCHLTGKGCIDCAYDKKRLDKTFTKEQFTNKANIIHNNKYNYSLVEYKGIHKNVDIICTKHGENYIFSQTPSAHLRGQGCFLCGKLKISKSMSENPTGWTTTNWIDSANKSKNFDSFKVYIIKCWNENEEFYKIGRTYSKISYRFKNKTALPYNYEIIKEIIGEAKYIFDLENQLKKRKQRT